MQDIEVDEALWLTAFNASWFGTAPTSKAISFII